MKDFYHGLGNIYSQDLNNKKKWYSSVANDYDKVRPSYDLELIKNIIKLLRIPDDAVILELGCGSGTATVNFAELDYHLLCLEPNYNSYELAKGKCQKYPKVEIFNTTFEEFTLINKRFNVVLAATSFHWISADIRYEKVAHALQNDGYLILLWNTPPQPDETVCQLLTNIYQTYAPDIQPYVTKEHHLENLQQFGEKAIASGLFKGLISEHYVYQTTYSIDDYISLLNTLSPYIKLESKTRDALFTEIKTILNNKFNHPLDMSYITAFQLVQKK